LTVNITLATIDAVRGLAKQAGAEIMKIYNSGFTVETKADNSPVTEADRISEKLIIEGIRKEITDAFPIIAEEAVATGDIPEIGNQPFWLVDALDGTKQFIQHQPEFTVNIALIDAGQPVLGVVHVPVENSTYWGSSYGAFAESGGGAPRPIACRPVPKKGVVVAVSKSHRTPETDSYLATLNIGREIDAGSSLKFCLVATGRADIYPRFGRTMEWDTAAGHSVLRFAGGSVTEVDGGDFNYGKEGFENSNFIAKGAGN
jgi:3'(2'), 5'-bisphosphate nucleotidase